MSTTPQPPRPLALHKDGDDALIIDWSDGHQARYAWKHIRQHCPCASCREDHHGGPVDPFRILSEKDLAPKPPLKPTALTPIGHYAYKITWNDGHDTGIYTLENLRALCQCDQCKTRNAERGTQMP